MEQDELSLLQEMLGEADVDAELALAVLLRTLINRHIDCERKKRTLIPAAQIRPDALIAVGDALYEAQARHAKGVGPRLTGAAPPPPPAPIDDPIAGYNLPEIQTLLFHIIGQCQLLSESRDGLDDDPDDDTPPPDVPHMRLVK